MYFVNIFDRTIFILYYDAKFPVMDRCFSTKRIVFRYRTELYFVASRALFIYREKIPRRIFIQFFLNRPRYVYNCSDESNKCFLIREPREEMKFDSRIKGNKTNHQIDIKLLFPKSKYSMYFKDCVYLERT